MAKASQDDGSGYFVKGLVWNISDTYGVVTTRVTGNISEDWRNK